MILFYVSREFSFKLNRSHYFEQSNVKDVDKAQMEFSSETQYQIVKKVPMGEKPHSAEFSAKSAARRKLRKILQKKKSKTT